MRDNAQAGQKDYRPDIDGLRAIAIIFVVGYHTFPRVFPRGFIGVDIFFVISGFLMMRIISGGIESGTFSFTDFYGRRIRRLFPALLVMMLFCLAMGWCYLFPTEFKRLASNTVSGVAFISNLALLRESDYFAPDAITQPLLHLWSLGIEEQFYIFWPLFLYLYSKFKRDALPLTLILLVVSFLFNMAWYINTPTRAFYMPFSRLWELIIGSIIVALDMRIARRNSDPAVHDPLAERLARLGQSQSLRNALSVFGFVVILAALFVARPSRYPGGWALLPTLGAAALIVAGPTACVNRTILARKSMIFIGLISYPLYLWHWPLLSFAHSLLPQASAIPARLGVVTASIALAYLTYRFVETPVRRGLLPWRVQILVGVSVALVGCALVVPRYNGFPGRFPPAIAELTSYEFDYKAAYRFGTHFLDKGQDWSLYSKADMAPLNNGEKRVLLWGDSFAAHLYLGLKANAPKNVRIVQRTYSSCLPIFGYEDPDNPICRATNDKIFTEMQGEHFDTIILNGFWLRNPDAVIGQLGETVQRLRSLASRVVVVGPLPRTPRSRYDLIHAYLHKHPEVQSLAEVPDWLTDDQVFLPVEYDEKFRKIVNAAGGEFATVFEYLCKSDRGECLVKLGDTPQSIVAFDKDGHLTQIGSEYLTRVVPELQIDSNE